MKRRFGFRNAADGGNLVVIGVAVGVIVLISLYLFSQNMMGKTAETQTNIGKGLAAGIAELKK